ASYNALRGELGAGLKGPALASALSDFQTEVAAAFKNNSGRASLGVFGTAFAVSFLTIVRDGVEVILLLPILFSLFAKSGQPRYRDALLWGIGAALLASLGTAVSLNRLMASQLSQRRELLEGLVMLAASGLLFYVSYWLISRSEAKRWAEFLKRQV